MFSIGPGNENDDGCVMASKTTVMTVMDAAAVLRFMVMRTILWRCTWPRPKLWAAHADVELANNVSQKMR